MGSTDLRAIKYELLEMQRKLLKNYYKSIKLIRAMKFKCGNSLKFNENCQRIITNELR